MLCAMLDQYQNAAAVDDGLRRFRMKRRPEERIHLLGGAMDLVKADEVFHFAGGRISAKQKAIVANQNLHSLALSQTNPEIREFFLKSDLIEVDSIPLILWARLVGRPSRRFHRCTYLDWRDDFWALVERNNWRVFFVGGRPGVAASAGEKIRAERPGVRLETHHGYFDIQPGSNENATVVSRIQAFAPDILLVGMGMPLQESWVLRNHDDLPACVIFTVGGAFDYEAGVQRACPRWIGRIGAEWLFRLATNPRLFVRYVIEPWRLIGPAIGDVLTAMRRRSASERRSATRISGSAPADSVGAGGTIA
jgi:N-acetylglucosaminyldiphosphoundecaprenol N-acetyl-beta-D-mannosaminyltransferase